MAGAAVVNPSVQAVNSYRVTEEKVIDVVETIVAKAAPLRITAFGSRARGTHRPESDLDLAHQCLGRIWLLVFQRRVRTGMAFWKSSELRVCLFLRLYCLA
jgi:hypothetical protein